MRTQGIKRFGCDTEENKPLEPKAEPGRQLLQPLPQPAQGAAAPAHRLQASLPRRTARDEKWWREKFEAARTDIRRAENQAAVAQLELNSANRDYLTRSYDPDGRGPAAVAAATKKLEDTNAAVAAARAKLTQLEEELRRAGAPAGWAR